MPRSVDVNCGACKATIRCRVGKTETIPITSRLTGAVTWFTVCPYCKSDVLLYEETGGKQ